MALIYVVEDDKNIQEIETFALANVGYEVKGFDSAMDFYEALNDTTPDLILLDIMLPDEDGLSIVKKLRRPRRSTRSRDWIWGQMIILRSPSVSWN